MERLGWRKIIPWYQLMRMTQKKKLTKENLPKTDDAVIFNLETLTSSLNKMKKIMFLVIARPTTTGSPGLVTIYLLDKAQIVTCKLVQEQAFNEEISSLRSNRLSNKSSSLFKLEPLFWRQCCLKSWWKTRQIKTCRIWNPSSYPYKSKNCHRDNCEMESQEKFTIVEEGCPWIPLEEVVCG